MKHAIRLARSFRCKNDKMTLAGLLGGGDDLIGPPAADEIDEIMNHQCIPSAVEVVGTAGVDNFLTAVVIIVHFQLALFQEASNRRLAAGNSQRTHIIMRMPMHIEARCHSIVVFKGCNLVIDDRVVAAINASAIRTFSQRLQASFIR